MPIVSFSFLVSGQREGTVFPKEVTLHPGRALSKPSCGALRKSKACSVLSSLLWGEGLFVLFSGFACFNREFSSPGLDKVKVLVKCQFEGNVAWLNHLKASSQGKHVEKYLVLLRGYPKKQRVQTAWESLQAQWELGLPFRKQYGSVSENMQNVERCTEENTRKMDQQELILSSSC